MGSFVEVAETAARGRSVMDLLEVYSGKVSTQQQESTKHSQVQDDEVRSRSSIYEQDLSEVSRPIMLGPGEIS